MSQLGSQHCAQKHSWFLFDALGTTLGLAGDSGSLSDTFVYEAFGTSLGRTGTTATPYQYVGGYGYFREASVGLEQVWWRWLLASAGAWVSRDPLARSGAEYVYGRSSPLYATDPTGLQDEPGGDAMRVCQESYMRCLQGINTALKCTACAALGLGLGAIYASLCGAAVKAKNIPAMVAFCFALPVADLALTIWCLDSAIDAQQTEMGSCDFAYDYCRWRADRHNPPPAPLVRGGV